LPATSAANISTPGLEPQLADVRPTLSLKNRGAAQCKEQAKVRIPGTDEGGLAAGHNAAGKPGAGAGQQCRCRPQFRRARHGARYQPVTLGHQDRLYRRRPRTLSEIINVIDLEGDAKIVSVLKNTEKIGDFAWCEWATDTRLICQVAGMGKGSDGLLVPFDRLFAINADVTEAQMLSQRDSYRALCFNQNGGDIVAFDVSDSTARGEWGFDWLVQFFTARGYAVLQPNYRGSSGYGEAWYGRNSFKAWDVAIGDVNDAGRWLVKEGIAQPDQLAIVGWSYGGYAALQSQVLDPALFKAVVAIAPVVDLGFLADDARGYTSARLVQEYVGTGPHIEVGSSRRHAEKLAAPEALFDGTRDLNVDVRHDRTMEKALNGAGKPVIYHEYEDLQHGLEDTTARIDMLTTIGSFLDEHLGRGG
jgi:dienelactone hydrolase